MDKRIENIPEGMAMVMTYPKLPCMMTGIIVAKQTKDGNIHIIYEDGTEEVRYADFYIEDKTCFEVVSYVQAGRI